MREFMKESGVPAEEAENGDSKTQKLLPIRDCFGGDEGSWGAFNGVFEDHGSFQIGFFVDYVVEALVLDPFQTNFGYGATLLVVDGGVD